MRDLEDLILHTIHAKLVEVTGIPSGLVLAKMPDFEFVNKLDSNIQTATNSAKFPSIGMRYFDKVRYKTNTYGSEHNIDNGDGTGILYSPLGEMSLPISIYLFTETRADQMSIGNIIRSEFMKQLFYPLANDELDDEYVQIEFIGFNDVQSHRPYVKCFDIICSARELESVCGYIVGQIDVNLQTQTNSITANVNQQNTFVYGLEVAPDPLDATVDAYFHDWVIIPVDLTSGSEERLEDL